jgi:hypothetical protein
MQLLPNGNALVGWGSQPYFSEYTKAGKMLLDAVFPGKDLSYRALYTDDWVGSPDFPPSGAARTVHGKTTVYASWNGATRVAAWRVLAGRAVGQRGRAARRGRASRRPRPRRAAGAAPRPGTPRRPGARRAPGRPRRRRRAPRARVQAPASGSSGRRAPHPAPGSGAAN